MREGDRWREKGAGKKGWDRGEGTGREKPQQRHLSGTRSGDMRERGGGGRKGGSWKKKPGLIMRTHGAERGGTEMRRGDVRRWGGSEGMGREQKAQGQGWRPPRQEKKMQPNPKGSAAWKSIISLCSARMHEKHVTSARARPTQERESELRKTRKTARRRAVIVRRA